MAFDSDAAAAEALAAANNGDSSPVEAAPEQAPVVAAPENTVDAGTTPTESPSFDINAVPEHLRSQVQEFMDGTMRNADYTRKTQEIAPIRQLVEQSGMSVEEAQQALAFVQNLNDPAQLQALYDNLRNQFDPQGQEGYEEGEEVDPRDTQLKDLSTRLQRFETAQAQTEAVNSLNSAVSSVKTAHPDFQDADMQRVQQLAVAHMSGDYGQRDVAKAMTSAASEYANWKQATLTEYINSKGSSSASGVPAFGQTAHAETPPPKFANLDEATKAAMAVFGNSI